MKLLAAVSPSIEYLYEGKAYVVYMQVTVWSTSERLVVEVLTIGVIQVRFFFLPNRARRSLTLFVWPMPLPLNQNSQKRENFQLWLLCVRACGFSGSLEEG